MNFHLCTSAGQARALAYADKLTDRDRAGRIREIVGLAEASGDWGEKVDLTAALNNGAPTPAEIAARAEKIRAMWQILDRPTGTHPVSKIEWPARGRRDETDVAKRRILTSLCGRYRIVENTYKLKGMPKRVHAMVSVYDRWEIISHHKEIGPAMEACGSHARTLAPMAAG